MNNEGLEIVFVSSDRSPEDMVSYMKGSHGDWLALEHGSEASQELKKKFQVTGIPTLVVVNKESGEVITQDGRAAVQSKGPVAVKDWLSNL